MLAAAVLAAAIKGIDTIDQAAEYAENNKSAAQQLVARELRFGWIYEDFIAIKESLKSINFKKIEQFDRAGQSTYNALDAHLIAICEKIENGTSGVRVCIEEIFSNEGLHPKLSHIVLQILAEVSQSAANIRSIARLLLKPALYRLTDLRLIVALLVIFIVSIPVWYIWKAEAQLGGQSSNIINAVVEQVQLDAERLSHSTSASANALGKIWAAAVFFWDTLLKLPAIIASLAIALQIVRFFLRLDEKASRQLSAYEDVLRKLATDFGVTGGPILTIKNYLIMGGSQGAVGDNASADNFTQTLGEG